MEKVMDKETRKNIDSWLSGDYDSATKAEIQRLEQEDPEELIDAFYRSLDFGTGGLRGIMGVGSNRMNPYTIRAATQGLANHILHQPTTQDRHAVVISYDSRLNSRTFAEETAKVLAGNNIQVYLFNRLHPVPLTSFAVQHLHCTAGVMITASHNPVKYNGYKVYWDYGGQVLPPHDKGIIEEVHKITSNGQVKQAPLSSPLISEIGEEIDQAYIDTVRPLQLHPGDNHTHGNSLSVVYTSLHGSGITNVPATLQDWGFTNLSTVEEQAIPDGHFSTLTVPPNPEVSEALAMGIEKLQAIKGDILIGTDPDCDRIGVVIMHQGTPTLLNGNQVACLLLDHILSSHSENHTLPPKPMVIKTIVTSELFRTIAEHYGVSCLDVLTGFKYIGEKIAQWEEDAKGGVTSHHYLFGGEESYGYLVGTHARDKDAVICSAAVCEMALHQKLRGKTLIDYLDELYRTYGIHREKLLSLTYEGKEGVNKMGEMMARLRENPPQIIGEIPVTLIEDYLNHTAYHLESGTQSTLVLPKSNVLRFWLSDGTKIVIRPSGTEPKIKLYCGAVEKHHHNDLHALEKGVMACDERLTTLLETLKRLLTTS